MPKLTIGALKEEAQHFSRAESRHKEKSLFGVTDGKAVGTYLEHKFRNYLRTKYNFQIGSSASGIDFPELQVDMKVTSISQPQSSSPFKFPWQKVYGVDYSLLFFIYEKIDDRKSGASNIFITHVLFLNTDRTADYYITKGLIEILNNEGNKDDVMAFIYDSRILFDDVEVERLANDILSTPPKLGFVLNSNDLRRRLNYFEMLDNMGNNFASIQIHQAI